MDKKTIGFRCDGSPTIGSGHIMRCLAVANFLTQTGEYNCRFISSEETYKTVPAISQSGFKVSSPEDKSEAVDVLIVDHYGLDIGYERPAREWVKQIVVIDDLADRTHDCDVLLDQTYGRKAEDYQPLTPAGCKILTGSNFALLRPEFQQRRDYALTRRMQQKGKVQNILISLGGTNIHNITSFVLGAFEKIEKEGLELTVVLNSKALHLDAVRVIVAKLNDTTKHKVSLILDATNVADLMAEADLALGAGGTTSWERCCMGLPTLMLEVADNQELLARNLHEAKAAYNLGWYEDLTTEDLSSKINNIISDPQGLMTMSEKAREICDGEGLLRLKKTLETIGDSEHYGSS